MCFINPFFPSTVRSQIKRSSSYSEKTITSIKIIPFSRCKSIVVDYAWSMTAGQPRAALDSIPARPYGTEVRIQNTFIGSRCKSIAVGYASSMTAGQSRAAMGEHSAITNRTHNLIWFFPVCLDWSSFLNNPYDQMPLTITDSTERRRKYFIFIVESVA